MSTYISLKLGKYNKSPLYKISRESKLKYFYVDEHGTNRAAYKEEALYVIEGKNFEDATKKVAAVEAEVVKRDCVPNFIKSIEHSSARIISLRRGCDENGYSIFSFDHLVPYKVQMSELKNKLAENSDYFDIVTFLGSETDILYLNRKNIEKAYLINNDALIIVIPLNDGDFNRNIDQVFINGYINSEFTYILIHRSDVVNSMSCDLYAGSNKSIYISSKKFKQLLKYLGSKVENTSLEDLVKNINAVVAGDISKNWYDCSESHECYIFSAINMKILSLIVYFLNPVRFKRNDSKDLYAIWTNTAGLSLEDRYNTLKLLDRKLIPLVKSDVLTLSIVPEDIYSIDIKPGNIITTIRYTSFDFQLSTYSYKIIYTGIVEHIRKNIERYVSKDAASSWRLLQEVEVDE